MRKLLFILLLLPGITLSQNLATADSLVTQLEKTENVDEKFELLKLIIDEYYTENKLREALVYSKMQVQIAETTEDIRHEADAYLSASQVYESLENFPLARDFILKSIERLSDLKDWEGLATAYDHLALIYDNEGKYPLSLKASRSAFDIYKRLEDTAGMASAYNDIGIIHYYLGEYDKALDQMGKSFELMKALDDSIGMAMYYNNTANIYGDRGDFDKALQYYFKAYAWDTAHGSLADQSLTLSNIGETYLAAGDVDKAERTLLKSLDLAKRSGSKWSQTNPMRALAGLYRQRKEYGKAIEYVKQSLILAEEISARAELSEGYMILSQIYEEAGLPEKALEAHKTFSRLEDSLFNRDNAMIIHEMETRYQSQAKDQQLKLLEKQREIEAARRKKEESEEQMIRFGLIGVLIVILIVTGLVGNALRMKRRSNKELSEQKRVIEKKNQELGSAFAQIEEKNKDITDSIRYAKRIQEALLPSSTEMEKVLGEYFVLFQPRDIVSGDFYWVFAKGDDRYFMVGDCTGHGVPGAFVSMLCVNALNHTVIEEGLTEPGKILSQVNALVLQGLKKEGADVKVSDGMDTSLCRINRKKMELMFAGAQNPVIVARQDDVIEVRGDKTPIGGRTEPDYAFETHQIALEKEDMIYCFSDGYADQFGGEKGKKFKHGNFRKLLVTLQHDNVATQHSALNQTLKDWKRDIEQLDDICVLGVRV